MHSKRSLEGYLLIDNRHAPGPGGETFVEVPTLTCSHCERQILVQPLRTRSRHYCRTCDHYICDQCAVIAAQSGKCEPFKTMLDRLQEEAARELNLRTI